MELYYLTESDPLEKFLFPYESEALRGDNFDDFEMAFFYISCLLPFICYFLSILSRGNENHIRQDPSPRTFECPSKGQLYSV